MVGRPHVLIIEDEATSIEVLQELLARQNVGSSVILMNIRTIIDDLENIQAPDVIFLDLEMPGMDGYHVLKLIRNTPHLQDIPVIAYTTHVSHLAEAHEAGFDGFIGKPLNRHKFINQLNAILNGESVWEVP